MLPDDCVECLECGVPTNRLGSLCPACSSWTEEELYLIERDNAEDWRQSRQATATEGRQDWRNMEEEEEVA